MMTMKDGFREALVACDFPEPCKLPFLDMVRASEVVVKKMAFTG